MHTVLRDEHVDDVALHIYTHTHTHKHIYTGALVSNMSVN